MLGKVKKHVVLLLFVSLILGLATVGFLLVPARLPGGPVQIRVSLGAPFDSPPSTAVPATHQIPDEVNASERVKGLLYDMGSKVVNLADPGGYRYLKAGIVLEVLPSDPEFYTLSGQAREEAKEHIREVLDEQRPIIEDIVTMRLSDKTFEEVFTIAGKEQLKQELRDELNARLTIGQVRDIYFTEFVIQ